MSEPDDPAIYEWRTPEWDRIGSVPAIVIVFPVEGQPYTAGRGSGTTADETVGRILDGLSPEWRELLEKALELKYPDLDNEDPG